LVSLKKTEIFGTPKNITRMESIQTLPTGVKTVFKNKSAGGTSEADLNQTYGYMAIVDRALPGLGLTNCLFSGNRDLTLFEAQKRKFDFVYTELRLQPGDEILEIGCGNGDFGAYLVSRGIQYTGLTPVTNQHKNCLQKGLYVECKKFQDFTSPKKFSAVVAMGMPEHLCNYDDLRAGEQILRYKEFFEFCHHFAKEGGRLYFQTMLFPEGQVPDFDEMRQAKKGDRLWYYHLLTWFYPHSWLGTMSQYKEAAQGLFAFETEIDGRLDYVITTTKWGELVMKFNPLRSGDWKKWSIMIGLSARALFLRMAGDKRLYMQLLSFIVSANRACFANGSMTHTFSIARKV
jgi:cyclopropane fatty-acyl-phospholipid synthase-like methyltransferase